MDGEHAAKIDAWWGRQIGLDEESLWRPGVHVTHREGRDELLVVQRDDAVHLSLPSWVGKKLEKDLRDRDVDDLVDRSFWKTVGKPMDRRPDHPTVHGYTDKQVADARGITALDPDEVAPWEQDVSPERWAISGFDSKLLCGFGVRTDKGVLAAASCLTTRRGSPVTVGVITHPAHRGRGFASRVARAATAAGVQDHGLVGYRARANDDGARSIGRTLGFHDHCVAMVVS